jgi:hypothetical protein
MAQLLPDNVNAAHISTEASAVVSEIVETHRTMSELAADLTFVYEGLPATGANDYPLATARLEKLLEQYAAYADHICRLQRRYREATDRQPDRLN